MKASLQKALLLLIVLFSVRSAEAQIMIQEGFEGTFPPAGWTLFNAGSGNDWSQNTATAYVSAGVKSMQYMYSTTSTANAWVFTNGFAVNTGDSVIVTFKCRARSTAYAENLKVTIGNAPSIANQAQATILDLPGITSSSYSTKFARTVVGSTGTYYIGFNCYSDPDKYYLYIDEVMVEVKSNTPCVNPPTAGSTRLSDTLTCANQPVTASLMGATTGTGQMYQWQQSSNGVNWTDVAGAISQSYTGQFAQPTYLRCGVTCGVGQSYSAPALISLKPASACYCEPVQSNTCASNIKDVTVVGTTLHTTYTCNSGGAAFTSFPDTGSVTATLLKSNSYDISVTTNSSNKIGMWIDYDQNGTFDPAEFTIISISSNINGASVRSFTVPSTALTGKTTMRIRTRGSANSLDAYSSCTSFASGESRDYTITIADPVQCSGTPVVGATVSSVDSACTDTVQFSLAGLNFASGLTFQWEISSDATNWTPIPGATLQYYAQVVNTPAYFRCAVTCAGTSYSTPVFVTVKPYKDCYCPAPHVNTCNNLIKKIVIEGTPLNNSVSCVVGGTPYTVMAPAANTTADLALTTSYTLTVTTPAGANISMWIDYNHNGTFDVAEWTQVSAQTMDSLPVSKSFTIPGNALTGPTKMRIRTRAATSQNDATSACLTFGGGESQDYTVTITGTVSVNQFNTNSPMVSLNPNPAHQSVSVLAGGLKGTTIQMALFNLNGQKVLEDNAQVVNGNLQHQLQLEGLTKGIYMLQLKNGNELLVQKLVIQ